LKITTQLDDSKYSRFCNQLKLALDYCFVFSIPRGVWVVASILIARLLRRPYIRLPVPGTRRTIRLRTASSDIVTYNQIFIRREYDFSYFPQAVQLLSGRTGAEGTRPPLTIIDCGANVGCSVIWFASEFPGAEIIAIEPDLGNFELLKENVAQVEMVHAIRAALWSSATRVVISNPDAESWAFRIQTVTGDKEQPTPLIDTVTMDGLLANVANSTRLIVKIDIEGAEYEVFSRNTSWLSSVDLLIIELHDQIFPGAGNGRAFFAAVAPKPMDYLWRGENLFCFQERGSFASCDSRGPSLRRSGCGARMPASPGDP